MRKIFLVIVSLALLGASADPGRFPIETVDLADNTDGEIPTWDSNGVSTTFGPGTANQYVASQGAGAEPIFKSILDEDDLVSDSATDVASQQSIKAFVTSGTVTMSAKTLTSPVLNTGISGTAFLDEDNMASDSASKVASQQSVKKYVDDNRGQWIKIETKTASSSATIDFTTFSGTYRDFRIIGSSVVPASDGVDFDALISVAASFKSGAADYAWSKYYQNLAASGLLADSSDARLELFDSAGSAAGENVYFDITIYDPASAVLRKQISGSSGGQTSAGANVKHSFMGNYIAATSAIDGIQFLFSSGDVESGTFTLYGRSN